MIFFIQSYKKFSSFILAALASFLECPTRYQNYFRWFKKKWGKEDRIHYETLHVPTFGSVEKQTEMSGLRHG